jgi:hypothetical protein
MYLKGVYNTILGSVTKTKYFKTRYDIPKQNWSLILNFVNVVG